MHCFSRQNEIYRIDSRTMRGSRVDKYKEMDIDFFPDCFFYKDFFAKMRNQGSISSTFLHTAFALVDPKSVKDTEDLTE